MKYITDKEYNARMNEIKLKNKSKERMQKLKKENNKYSTKIKLPSTSKLVLLGAVLLCLEIVIFAEYVMLHIGDTSAMYALIGIPATLVPIVWAYYSKSKAENTQGGITYDLAMAQITNSEVTNDSTEEETQTSDVTKG